MAKKTSTPKILYRDRALVAVHKPSGFVIYADQPAAKAISLQDWLQKRLPAGGRAFPVHRLDKETCGIVLFALDPRTASLLQKGFREGKIEKTYWALAAGNLPERGRWTKPVKDSKGESRSAQTEFRELAYAAAPRGEEGEAKGVEVHLLELHPRTGRFHQIRQHAALAGAPLLGDVEYGGAREWRGNGKAVRFGRVALSAVEVSFAHPLTRKRVDIRTRPDQDFDAWTKALFAGRPSPK